MSDDEVHRKHRKDLIRYATALVGPDRAEDVLSTVVLRVLASGGFGRIDDARPYLFRAVLNKARTRATVALFATRIALIPLHRRARSGELLLRTP